MGSYSGEGSVSELLNVRLCLNSNSELLNSFDKSEEKALNSFLVFDKDFNVSKFLIKELDLDIKDCLRPEHIEYYKSLYHSGKRLIQEDFVIDYSVSGYYDPGYTSGPPENCYPPEGDEERNLVGCIINLPKIDSITLPESCFDKVYGIFKENIEAEDFSDNSNDYCDDRYYGDYDHREYDNTYYDGPY